MPISHEMDCFWAVGNHVRPGKNDAFDVTQKIHTKTWIVNSPERLKLLIARKRDNASAKTGYINLFVREATEWMLIQVVDTSSGIAWNTNKHRACRSFEKCKIIVRIRYEQSSHYNQTKNSIWTKSQNLQQDHLELSIQNKGWSLRNA